MALQDLHYFKSKKTNRGLLQEGWINSQEPIMCSYKLVTVKFEVWGLQTRVEQFVHKVGTENISQKFQSNNSHLVDQGQYLWCFFFAL